MFRCFDSSSPHPVRTPSGPFSKSNVKEWANGAWQLLCFDYGGHPENDPKLRAIGKYRAAHYLQPEPTGRSIAKTESSNIANGIKAELTKTIGRLAKGKKTRKVPGK